MPPKKKEVAEPEPEVPKEPLRGNGAFLLETPSGLARYSGDWVEADRVAPAASCEEDGEEDETKEALTTEEEEALLSIGKIQDGQGTLVLKDTGERFCGKWENGLFIQGKLEFPNGDFYKGEFGDGGCFHGHGSLETSDFEYIGGWEDHAMHGHGTLKIFSDNTTWQGTFDQGRFVGGYGHLNHLALDKNTVPPVLRQVLG